MLITKEVEVTVTGNTGDYWLSKGYNVKTNIVKGKIVFPKGQKIRVKIEDLKRFYTVLVDVKCDYCSKIVKMEYSRYASLRGDTYCCPDCLSHKKKCRDDNGKLIFVEIPYRNKDWLYEEYIVKDREAQDIFYKYGKKYVLSGLGQKELSEKYGEETAKKVIDYAMRQS